jgi:hypothetical protein
MSALAEAFFKAGLHPRDAAFDVALTKYINSGGTFAGARERIDAAELMSGRGHVSDVAISGRGADAPTRQPVEDGGACLRLPDSGRPADAQPSSFNRGGEGLPSHAQVRQPPSALPVREPKPQRAPIDFGAASVAIKTKLAQTVLDRVQTNDGRAWGDVKYYELDHMGRDGALAQALRNHIGVLTNNTQYCMPIRDLVNAETFESIRSQVNGA